MQLLLSRAGLALNPGQVADLVLAWRQVAGLIAGMPHDRPLADDMAYVFRLTPPGGTTSAKPSRAAPRPKVKAPARPAAKARPKAQAKAKPKAKAQPKAKAKPRARVAPKRRAAPPPRRKSGKRAR